MNANAIRKESPLAQFMARKGAALRAARAGVLLRERRFLGHINLRGDSTDAAWAGAVEGILGVPLPLRPNTAATLGERVIHWLGPDEWLIVCPGEEQGQLFDALLALQGERHMAATAVGGGQTVIRLSGERVREVFAKGCTLDFHPWAFQPGDCAQSTLGKAPALFRLCDDGAFELVIRRSFADYIGLWLADAAEEFGLCVVED